MSEDALPDRSGPQGPTEKAEPAPAPGTAHPGSGQSTAPRPQPPQQWWTQTPTQPKKTVANPLPLIRLAWAVLIATVLLLTWGSGPEAQDWQQEIRSAMARAELNNASAEGAPQQQVVNGWQAADLAEIQIAQNISVLDHQGRNANLLLVLGLGIFGDLALRAANDQLRARHRDSPPRPA